MDKARIGTLAVIAFFVVSIIAYSAIYQYPEPAKPTGNEQPAETTQISMQAKDVTANVALLLPKVKILAQTNETEINKIDSSIYSIEGVRGVASQFILADNTEISEGMTYIADVQISDANDVPRVISLIKENAHLKDVEGFLYALADLPKDIEFSNPDLNISKKYSLKGNETLALVSPQTIAGDSIKVEISATFVGNDVLSALAFESENISAMPILGTREIEADIASLEQKLLLDITCNYSQLPLLDSVEQGIRSMQGISDFNLSKPEIDPKISLIKDENISEEKAADLNAFLRTLSNDIIFYNEDTFRASLFFGQGADLLPIEDSIKKKLDGLDLNITVRESVGHATGEAMLQSTDTATILPQIKSLLEKKGLGEFSLTQPGKISLSEITADDGKTYGIESGLVDAEFSNPHLIGEKSNVEISYYIVRGKIEEISAIEKE